MDSETSPHWMPHSWPSDEPVYRPSGKYGRGVRLFFGMPLCENCAAEKGLDIYQGNDVPGDTACEQCGKGRMKRR